MIRSAFTFRGNQIRWPTAFDRRQKKYDHDYTQLIASWAQSKPRLHKLRCICSREKWTRIEKKKNANEIKLPSCASTHLSRESQTARPWEVGPGGYRPRKNLGILAGRRRANWNSSSGSTGGLHVGESTTLGVATLSFLSSIPFCFFLSFLFRDFIS